MDEKTNPPTELSLSATKKAREILARHYADRFWSSLSSTSAALVVWLAALLLIWGGYILPLPGKLSQLGEFEKKVSSLEKQIPLLEDRVDQPEMARDEQKRLNLQQEREFLKEILDERRRSSEQLQEDLDKIDTPLGTLEIKRKYVPAFWAILFVGLLTFYVHRKILLLAMIGRAIRIHVFDLGDKLGDLRGLGAWAPFWLAPLPPPMQSSQVTREDIRAFLGWRSTGWREISSLLVLAALMGLYVSVLVISWIVVKQTGNGEGQLRTFTIVVLGFLYCLALGFFWLWRPVCYDSFPDQLLADLPGRRTFLSLSGATLLVGFGALLFPRIFASGLLPKRTFLFPRYRKPIRKSRNPLTAGLKNSFQLDKKSKVIHYVDWQGWSAGADMLEPNNLQAIDPRQVQALLLAPEPKQLDSVPAQEMRLNRGQSPQMAERLALEEARQGRLDRALDVLWQGIERDSYLKKLNLNRPSYRLYEFYAGLAVRASKRGNRSAGVQMKRLREHIKEHWPTDARLEQRLAVWQSYQKDSGQRSKRWTEEEIPWRLPEKRPSGQPPV